MLCTGLINSEVQGCEDDWEAFTGPDPVWQRKITNQEPTSSQSDEGYAQKGTQPSLFARDCQ